MKKRIIIDADIPYIRNIFDKTAEVQYLKGKSINAENAKNADALIIRTRTQCDEKLLQNSDVSFIGTATIGTDHIDIDYCNSHGITVRNAPGCNANAVAQYVWNAIIHFFYKETKNLQLVDTASFLNYLKRLKVGIIGYGHVGKAVARIAKSIGTDFYVYDPPLAKALCNNSFFQLNEVLNSDIITVHTPLTSSGDYPTLHMIDENIFSTIESNGRKPLIINAARGGIIKEEVLLKHLEKRSISGCIIDCWENEPDINKDVLSNAFIATPHIAGYSIQGKYNATKQIVNELCTAFNYGSCEIDRLDITQKEVKTPLEIVETFLADDRLEEDTKRLKTDAENFEIQRNTYDYRNEIKLLS